MAVRLRDLQAQIDNLLNWGAYFFGRRIWEERFNELRFVRATLAWEYFIEQSFICYLRGSPTLSGRTQSLNVQIASNSSSAQTVAIGSGNFYGKWLNENWTLQRAIAIFGATTHPYIPLANPIFPQIRKIRNKIVHRSDSSRNEFQGVILNLYGSTKPGMTPGRLLSDLYLGRPRIERYFNDLKAVGTLIVS